MDQSSPTGREDAAAGVTLTDRGGVFLVSSLIFFWFIESGPTSDARPFDFRRKRERELLHSAWDSLHRLVFLSAGSIWEIVVGIKKNVSCVCVCVCVFRLCVCVIWRFVLFRPRRAPLRRRWLIIILFRERFSGCFFFSPNCDEVKRERERERERERGKEKWKGRLGAVSRRHPDVAGNSRSNTNSNNNNSRRRRRRPHQATT